MEENDNARDIDRMLQFSDAIFAFAITLLVVTIDIPKIPPELADKQLQGALLGLWPQFESYLISFIVIGSFWVAHHQRFRHLRRYDRIFIWLNLFCLMFISLLPFSTNLMGDYNAVQIVTIIYSLNMFFIGLLFSLLWWYATYKRRLIDEHLSKERITESRRLSIAIPIIFAISIGLSFFYLPLARYVWLLALPLVFFLLRK